MPEDIDHPGPQQDKPEIAQKKTKIPRNWPAIKQEFLHGHMTLKALATKVGVPCGTVQSRAWHERWIQSRDEMNRRADEADREQTIEERAKASATLDQHAHDLGIALLEQLYTFTLREKGLAQFNSAATALKTLYPLLRMVEGLPAEKTISEAIDPLDGLQPILHFNDKGEPFLITHQVSGQHVEATAIDLSLQPAPHSESGGLPARPDALPPAVWGIGQR